jgi:hypothetical protein
MDLAQEIIERVCRASVLAEFPPGLVALAIVGSVPTLAGSSQEQCQDVFDQLIDALAARMIELFEFR